MDTTLRNRLTRSRIDLISIEPFFGTLVMRLALESQPGLGTAATDGDKISFDPAFVGTLQNKELNLIMAHEALHCALGHHVRRGQRDPYWWNVAADHVVNLILDEVVKTSSRTFAWPKFQVFKDPQFAGKAVEEVYNLVYNPNDDGGGKGKKGTDPGSMGGVQDPQGKDADAKARSAAEWKEALTAAAQQIKAQHGKLPAGLGIATDRILNPRIPWTDQLRNYIITKAADDWTWSKPNKRHAWTGLYLPSLRSETCPPLAACIDTSGSCVYHVGAFLSEVQAILDEVRPEYLTVLDIDAAVGSVQRFEPGDIIPTKVRGGGGTDFRPAFDHFNRSGEEPACLIYLTDLEGTFPTQAPCYDTLWVATTNHRPPFGDVIRID